LRSARVARQIFNNQVSGCREVHVGRTQISQEMS
jgi:hypothetical protein